MAAEIWNELRLPIYILIYEPYPGIISFPSKKLYDVNIELLN